MAFDGNVVIGTTVDMYGMNEGLKKIEKSFKKIGKLSTSIISVAGLVKLGKAALNAASNLQEVQNIVDVSFGDLSYKMEKFAETAIRSYGMSEYSAKKTGSAFMAMGKAMGLTAEEASNMAIRLTALSGDFASFYNISQEYAQIALSGIYTGESRTLKKYGLVITEANLQQYALTKGIETQVKKMDARSKALLRYNYILEATKDMEGDFIRTQNTWANQTRILKEQWNQFLIVLGNGLITVLTPLIKGLNDLLAYMIAWANKMGKVLAKLLGIKWQDITAQSSGAANNLEDMADAEKDLADATDKATKSQKKQLATYDELNNVTQATTKGTEDLASTFGVPDISNLKTDITGGFENIKDAAIDNINSWMDLGDYIGKKLTDMLNGIDWDSIYQGARDFGKGLAEFLNGLISPELFRALGHTIAGALNTVLHFLDSFGETFDFYNFGASFAAGLNKFMEDIDWKTALSAAKNWGKGIADAINGFLREANFYEIGNTIAQGLNTVVEFVYNFVTTLNWSKVGTGIGTSINGLLENFDWNKTLTSVERFATGLADTINGAFATIKWDKVGETASNFVNAIFLAIKDFATRLQWDDIGRDIAMAITNFFKKLKTSDIAEGINALVQGIWTAIYTFMVTADWKTITGKIADLLSHIDIKTVAIVLGAIELAHVGQLVIGFSLTQWLRTALLAPMVQALGEIFNTAFGLMAANIPGMGAVQAFQTAVQAVLGTVGAAIAGISVAIGGIVLFVKGFVDQWKEGFNIIGQVLMVLGTILGVVGAIVAGVMAAPAVIVGAVVLALGEIVLLIHQNWDAIKQWWSGVVEGFKKSWSDLVASNAQVWQHNIDDIKKWWSDFITNIKQGWDNFILTIKTKWEEFKTAIKTGLDNIKAWWKDKIDGIKQLWDNFKTKVSEIFNGIKDFIEEKATNIKDKWDEIIGDIKGFFEGLWDKACEIVDNIKRDISERVDDIQLSVTGAIDTVKDAFEHIPDFFKDRINDIIGFFEGLANAIIDVGNTISDALSFDVDIPDWVPKIGGKSFGISLPSFSHISIPRLAQGAVIPPNREFMAMLGDQHSGTNVEAPLATIQEALYNALLQAGLTGGGSSSQDIVVQIDGREIARAVRREDNIFRKSTGSSMFAY